MNVTLYNNSSENNVIGKNLTTVKNLTCTLKDRSSIINPVLILETDSDIVNANYLYIPLWNRYYFINSIEALTGTRYVINAVVDVLQSFASGIKASSVLLMDTEVTGKNNYLSSENWVSNVKNKTDIVVFPSGLNEQGEFILITAGG